MEVELQEANATPKAGKENMLGLFESWCPKERPPPPQGGGNQIPEDEALAEWCWYHRSWEDVSIELRVSFVERRGQLAGGGISEGA